MDNQLGLMGAPQIPYMAPMAAEFGTGLAGVATQQSALAEQLRQQALQRQQEERQRELQYRQQQEQLIREQGQRMMEGQKGLADWYAKEGMAEQSADAFQRAYPGITLPENYMAGIRRSYQEAEATRRITALENMAPGPARAAEEARISDILSEARGIPQDQRRTADGKPIYQFALKADRQAIKAAAERELGRARETERALDKQYEALSDPAKKRVKKDYDEAKAALKKYKDDVEASARLGEYSTVVFPSVPTFAEETYKGQQVAQGEERIQLSKDQLEERRRYNNARIDDSRKRTGLLERSLGIRQQQANAFTLMAATGAQIAELRKDEFASEQDFKEWKSEQERLGNLSKWRSDARARAENEVKGMPQYSDKARTLAEDQRQFDADRDAEINARTTRYLDQNVLSSAKAYKSSRRGGGAGGGTGTRTGGSTGTRTGPGTGARTGGGTGAPAGQPGMFRGTGSTRTAR